RAKDFRVRAPVTRLAGIWAASKANDYTVWLHLHMNDEHPRVRLEAIRAFGGVPESQSVVWALSALDHPMDRTLDYALWLTVRELEPYWLPECLAGKLDFGGDVKKIAFALKAIGNKETIKPVVALIDGGKLSKENVHALHLLLTEIGGPEELGKVLAYADVERN